MSRTIVIVDPFSSGQYLAPELQKNGVDVVAIISSPALPAFYFNSFKEHHFKKVIRHQGDVEATAAAIRAFEPRAVIPGSEPGVILADQLAHELGLPTNDINRVEARRNKFLMLEALRSRGVAAAKQILCSRAQEAKEWLKREKISAFVMKPKDSAGTDGVVFAESEADLDAYFKKYLGKKNMLGAEIDEIIVQEFLEGEEYVVDTLSFEGRHQLIALWKYSKVSANGGNFVYDTMHLITDLGERELALFNYVKKALDALGITQGPAHNELMLTPRGPYLIESGARPHGGNGTLISGQCVGYNQIDRTALLFSKPEAFKSSFREIYESKISALEIFLISGRTGTFQGLAHLAEIEKLPSYSALTLSLKPGDTLPLTTDLFTSPGRVILIGANADLWRDHARVRAWEETAYVTDA